ncbi:GNAT family N-acetyltransferase [Cochlodiniinecator piscidefendens]|uniref:GNAT family N-acetyltransferase n=1 Tax=Cochlodiniinecator piscidefendens TaxID=2715756 RepID=UPI00140C220B|nr:GNAT family N-acetyltransferase [Cochlodiniinecator piscidefendens]
MTEVIRNAYVKDIIPVARILHEWNSETPWLPDLHSLKETEEFAEMMIGRDWVSVIDTGDVVGFIARDESEIHALYIAPHAARRGMGQTLICHAKARSDVLNLWTFERNVDAQKFYLSQGFDEVLRSDGSCNDEKLPDIRYAWQRAQR